MNWIDKLREHDAATFKVNCKTMPLVYSNRYKSLSIYDINQFIGFFINDNKFTNVIVKSWTYYESSIPPYLLTCYSTTKLIENLKDLLMMKNDMILILYGIIIDKNPSFILIGHWMTYKEYIYHFSSKV